MSVKKLVVFSSELFSAIEKARGKKQLSTWIREACAEKAKFKGESLKRGRPPETGVANQRKSRDT